MKHIFIGIFSNQLALMFHFILLVLILRSILVFLLAYVRFCIRLFLVCLRMIHVTIIIVFTNWVG